MGEKLRTVEVVELRIGPMSQQLTPSFSWCHHCGTTWPFVQGHSTPHNDNHGCFPLCELCWVELKTPKRRLPYYRQLWTEWQKHDPEIDPTMWDAIEAAVEKGL